MSSSEFGDANAYLSALTALDRKGIHPRHREMLETHYSARRHTITMTKLAAAVGYKNWNAANLQYGTLARRLAEILGVLKAPLSDTFPGGFWGYVLMDWVGTLDSAGHTAFVMRPELVSAMERHGWVMRPARRSGR